MLVLLLTLLYNVFPIAACLFAFLSVSTLTFNNTVVKHRPARHIYLVVSSSNAIPFDELEDMFESQVQGQSVTFRAGPST